MGSDRTPRAQAGGGVKISEKSQKSVKVFENILVPTVLFLVHLSASLLCLHSVYWFFPVSLGLVSVSGYFFRKRFLLDAGILLSLLSFLFAYRVTKLTLTSLITVVALIFLYVGIWTFSRNEIVVKAILDTLGDISPPDSFVQYRISRLKEITTNMVLGIFLSIIGFLVASFSTFDIPKDLQVPMIVIFSVGALTFVYVIFLALPDN